MINRRLIYDIGMHNGDDTAYYLYRGFDVVAVEADPDLAAAGMKRFATQIEGGRLTIVNKAICDRTGEASFWICDELRVWNSFDRASASRNGFSCHEVKVQTVPLSILFEQYGVPYYLKIDIEGHDHIAVADIPPGHTPPYISMEISSVDDFFLLRSKGYHYFKCIQQGYFKPVTSPRLKLKTLLSMYVTRLKSLEVVNAVRRRWKQLYPAATTRAEATNVAWVFDPASSGPFGEDTPGAWLSFEQVLHAWLTRQLVSELGYYTAAPGLECWFDLHARA